MLVIAFNFNIDYDGGYDDADFDYSVLTLIINLAAIELYSWAHVHVIRSCYSFTVHLICYNCYYSHCL